MKSISVKAPAKLNLNLHVLPRKLNGYHQIKFLNCQIDLCDELVFEKNNKNIEIICDNPQIPKGRDNLIYKAALLLKKTVNQENLGAKIILKKNIPVKAGLGGGSSDAAETIKALIKLWQLKLTAKQILGIIENLGTDVFYCYRGGICQVEDRGNKVTFLFPNMPNFWLLIIVPEEKKPSTAWMYKHLNFNIIGKNLHKFDKLKQAITTNNSKQILDNLFNDFESLTLRYFSIIREIKHDLLDKGARSTLLAGSGLSVVGFFYSKSEAIKARDNLKVKYNNITWTKTL